ncbi:hypothetical protein I8752_29655 [Nostocaceae cyanobacterium CENA369]|uniref:CopG-like ribbon-helix-helix domain-containing protein n=1 Tax=Dendronalium phyllosphericum CENA369 TaxID=1725256 RepID=A0A8J7I944_9NOST|nr:hypothetical protein [Dendronalium phyllosphericum]MBH8577075.1 hypothetical protein [Dendronalium phyllosphericum CENA369]
MSPKYRGKRANVTFPPAVFDAIAKIAKAETRTVSAMIVILCGEALKQRGVEIATEENND